MTDADFTTDDLRRLAACGIDPAEASRQLETLRRPPSPASILRPCTVGDGIVQLADEEERSLLESWRLAVVGERVSKFVPASGAATRMFADLRAATEGEGSEPSPTAATVCERRGELAFAGALERLLASAETVDARTVARALLDADGLGLGSLPKALIPFHSYPEGPRTAFVEQLVEAAGYVAGGEDAAVRVHFTVAASHRDLFEAHLAALRAPLEAILGARLAVSFSTQDPSTDTLCLGADGAPLRDADGTLVLRPSGHGALLPNLENLGADIVVIKNIDNILPEGRQEVVVHWKRLLIGLLVRTEEALEGVARRLDRGEIGSADAAASVADTLGLEAPADGHATWARDRLRRPLRICGMVRNEGEPGGGPFWVTGAGGLPTPQIVEAAQVDLQDASRQEMWHAATHFNPVDLVCSLRDSRGAPYELSEFVDPATAFVSEKEHRGEPLRALERPGLWNGAMAGWNSLFVEVPAETFAPVKTVLDLLRPEHLPQRAAD